MEDSPEFVDNKISSDKAVSFVRHILQRSGYKVINFGIETHSEEIKRYIRGNYETAALKKLHTMPDLVVIEEDTGNAMLVEVKYKKRLDPLTMKHNNMLETLMFWNEAIMLFVTNDHPYCQGIKLEDVSIGKHLTTIKSGIDGKYGVWNMSLIYKDIKDLFQKVTEKHFDAALEEFNGKKLSQK